MEFMIMVYLNESIYRKKKKKGYFLYIGDRGILITTDANLLNNEYEFYGLNDDLI